MNISDIESCNRRCLHSFWLQRCKIHPDFIYLGSSKLRWKPSFYCQLKETHTHSQTLRVYCLLLFCPSHCHNHRNHSNCVRSFVLLDTNSTLHVIGSHLIYSSFPFICAIIIGIIGAIVWPEPRIHAKQAVTKLDFYGKNWPYKSTLKVIVSRVNTRYIQI